ncbi:MAG TPA: response regulator [Kofleriaceae bacterium]|nr:response regulator [Gaiellales bacterium]HVK73164.1 response regulator [Kofleriaceae bacterium]
MGADVLLAEDDDALREVTADLLRDAGFEVEVVRDGVEAMAALRAARPGVLLLDLMMPNLDGWQVVAQMRADPALATIPVCVLSAVEDGPAVQRTLRKPVTLAALLAAVRELSGKSP